MALYEVRSLTKLVISRGLLHIRRAYRTEKALVVWIQSVEADMFETAFSRSFEVKVKSVTLVDLHGSCRYAYNGFFSS